jgi:hypothetical protein
VSDCIAYIFLYYILAYIQHKGEVSVENNKDRRLFWAPYKTIPKMFQQDDTLVQYKNTVQECHLVGTFLELIHDARNLTKHSTQSEHHVEF